MSYAKKGRLKIIHESNLNHGDSHDDLMKECWDLNSTNRPIIIMLENIISEWIRCIDEYYTVYSLYWEVPNIDNQLENDMLEFVEASKTLTQEKANTSIVQSHTQAYYISRKLTESLRLNVLNV
ncbi:hypothetical protein C1646_809543 [Rhizophagus diaphanus]|nr:hypothetical protein C1646_809543 [Rhizophagus diaphanus] [Rhizophagus sp. MUCL 43196]